MSQIDQVEQKDVEYVRNERNDPAFKVVEVNVATGETIIIIQKGILGAMANQLKNTSSNRKSSSILRKCGYVLADCGDLQYGGSIEDTDLDPSLVIDQVNE